MAGVLISEEATGTQTHTRAEHVKTQKGGGPPERKPALHTRTWYLPPAGPWGNSFLLLKPPGPRHSVMAARAPRPVLQQSSWQKRKECLPSTHCPLPALQPDVLRVSLLPTAAVPPFLLRQRRTLRQSHRGGRGAIFSLQGYLLPNSISSCARDPRNQKTKVEWEIWKQILICFI